jgi:hypothetical protein
MASILFDRWIKESIFGIFQCFFLALCVPVLSTLLRYMASKVLNTHSK